MNTVRINRNIIEYYGGDIDELPAGRHAKFNQALMIDAGIGGTIEDVTRHYNMIKKYAELEDKEKMMTEIENMLASYYLVISGINPRMTAFAVLVKSINGKRYDDMSQAGIDLVVKKLTEADTQMGLIYRIVDSVKKKWKKALSITSQTFMTTRTKRKFTL